MDVDKALQIIEALKAPIIAILVLFMAFYVTVVPGVQSQYAGQWIGAGMAVVTAYVGGREVKKAILDASKGGG